MAGSALESSSHSFSRRPTPNLDSAPQSDRAFQAELLQEVSRTFALTIPQLPEPLDWVVGNAYLLCRLVDTIEDEPKLPANEKEYFAGQFIKVISDTAQKFKLTLN